MLKDKNSNISIGFPILVLENEWEYYISISHSVNIVISQVIIFIPFGGLTLQLEFGYLFSIMIVNLTWRQMFLRKLRFAASYRYISIMLQKDDLLLRK